jgi:hypothetical protein
LYFPAAYLVVVEVMEQPYPVHSFLLYAHGFEAMKEIAQTRLRTSTAASYRQYLY